MATKISHKGIPNPNNIPIIIAIDLIFFYFPKSIKGISTLWIFYPGVCNGQELGVQHLCFTIDCLKPQGSGSSRQLPRGDDGYWGHFPADRRRSPQSDPINRLSPPQRQRDHDDEKCFRCVFQELPWTLPRQQQYHHHHHHRHKSNQS